MDYLVKIRSVQTPLNGQFSIGANTLSCKTACKNCQLIRENNSKVDHVK